MWRACRGWNAADQQEEAASIALVLRDALETPGATAALVTPDRELAGRVAAELGRYGIVADDSAGEKLAETPPAVFLRLLARAVAEELAPVALLALLKHPLAAAGLTPAACRAAARALELACLRGPRPGPGITGAARWPLRNGTVTRRRSTCWTGWKRAWRRRCDSARPLAAAPAEALAALIEAAERLAATETATGAVRLWAGEEGEALADAAGRSVLEALRHAAGPAARRAAGAARRGAGGRRRCAAGGRCAGATATEHPRMFIWGLLEARLQTRGRAGAGRAWPKASGRRRPIPGRGCRGRCGRASGCPRRRRWSGRRRTTSPARCAPRPIVVLSCPRRRDGAPAVPARWLTRLEMFLAGRGTALPRHPASGWARALDQPAALRPAGPPPLPSPAARACGRAG